MNIIKLIAYAFLLIGAFIVVWLLSYLGGSDAILSSFSIWALLPYILLFISCAVANQKTWIWINGVISVISVIISVLIYYDAIFLRSSSTSGLAFISVPFIQILVSLVALIGTVILRKTHKNIEENTLQVSKVEIVSGHGEESKR